jgi:ribosomal protein S18 acetylase RimI-like enzyme
MRIRLANIDELPSLMKLIGSCILHMDNQGIHQWDTVYPNGATLQKDIVRRHLHIVEKDGHICGMIALSEDQSPEYQQIEWMYRGRILVVHRLAIDPAYQRQNLGTLLMDFAEGVAAAQGYNAIRLDAFTQNPGAVALYEKRQYRNAGTVMFRKGLFFCLEKEITRIDRE